MPLQTVAAFGGLTQPVFRPVKAGAVDFFVAPSLTAYNANVGYNGSWVYCGRIEPGSFKNSFDRKYYDVKSGLPETIKESIVTEVSGKMSCTFLEYTAKVLELANSGDVGKPIYGSTPVSTTTSAIATSADQITVTSATGLSAATGTAGSAVPGDMISVVTPNGTEFAYITGIAGTTLTLYPRLSALPASGAIVKRVDGFEEPAGTSTVATYALMCVETLTDGGQLVTWAPKGRAMGIKDDYAQGKPAVVPVEFELYGVYDAAYNGPIVAKKFSLNAAASLSLFA